MHFSALPGFRFDIFSTLDWMFQHKNLWALISHPAFCSFSWVLDGSKAYILKSAITTTSTRDSQTVRGWKKCIEIKEIKGSRSMELKKKIFIHSQPSRWSSFFPLMSIYALNRSWGGGGGLKGASRKGANRRYKHVTVMQDSECRFCC